MKKCANNRGAANTAVVALAVALVLVVVVGGVVIVRLLNRQESAATRESVAGLQIGYATDVGTALTEADLQAKMDAMMNKDSMMSLEYRNNASSKNGKDFSCYIANSEYNDYDMYIGIYGDFEMTDQLFLSQLIRPGTAFDHITLDRALEKGDHKVYCTMTQVKEENGELMIHNSTTVTMDFHVT